MKKKIFSFISLIAFIGLLVFASGIDHATAFTYIGIAVCTAWLGVFALAHLRREK